MQCRPPDDETAVVAGASERRAALVSKPHARGCYGRQKPSLVEPFCPHFRDVANGMMQCGVIIEENPRCRGEPPERIAGAYDRTATHGKPRVVYCLKRHSEADASRVVRAKEPLQKPAGMNVL